jgi:predicted ATPase
MGKDEMFRLSFNKRRPDVTNSADNGEMSEIGGMVDTETALHEPGVEISGVPPPPASASDAPDTAVQPQPTQPVITPKSPATSAAHSPTAVNALVEREHELDCLRRYWKETVEGHGKVVLLSGEAGHGKSTLADAFIKSVQAEGKLYKIARAACSAQSGRDEPFWPFADVIGQLAHTGGKKMAGDILDAVLDLAPSWASVIPVAGTVVGASIKTAQVVRTRTRTNDLPNPDKLLREYVGALKKVADKQPVLIFVDDVHWSDSASIKLLSHLSRNIGDTRVLIIVAYRPSDLAVEGHPLHELINELLRYDTETEIVLPPLTEDGTAALIKKLYPANKFQDSLASTLYANTGGSPFFIVESLRLMQSREQVVRDSKDGKWMLVREINDEDLPRSVEAVIRKRMERMPQELQDALAMAAVQGSTFESAVLAHALGIDELAVLKLLEPAEKLHDVIDYVGDVELDEDITSRFRFTSNLIQRELLETLRGKQLLLAHRKTAEGLEKIWGNDSDDLAPKLATHYEKGKIWDRAAYYNIVAGKQSRAAGAIPQAIVLFENAERLLRKCGAIPPASQFEVDDNLSYLYELDSSYDKADGRTRRALEAGYEALGWRKFASLQMRLAKLADNAGRHMESLQLLQHLHELMDSATPADQTSPEVFDLHAEIAQALTRVSRADEGAQYAEDGLSDLSHMPKNEDTQRLRLHLLIALAEAHAAQGHYRQVVNLLDEIITSARQLHVVDTLSEGLVNLAQLQLTLGQYDKATEAIKNLLETAQQISSESLSALSYVIAGRALIYQGRFAEALRQFEEGEKLMLQTRYYSVRPQLLALRGLALINSGRMDEAQAALDQARPMAEASGSRESVATIDLFKAMVALTQENPAKALPLAQSAAQVFTEEGARFEQAWALRAIGRAYRLTDQFSLSRKAYNEAKAIYEVIGNQHQAGVTTEESEL